MSRNDKLRKIAGDLPQIIKRDRTGRVLFDQHGCPIKVDHFKEMLKIRDKVRDTAFKTAKDEVQMIGNYCVMIKAQHEAYLKKRRNRRAKVVATIILVIMIAYFLK